MPEGKILIVEDDRKTADSLRLYLEHAGFAVSHAPTGKLALEIARNTTPDLVLLDLMLPEMSGWDVCRVLRESGEVPIIMVTARATEEDKLRGLELGADDYITKPFSPREVVARVRAVLRRAKRQEDSAPAILKSAGIVLDRTKHSVEVRGGSVALTPAEFRLLRALMVSPGRAFTREQLVERAFGPAYDGFDRTIDAHIKNLRAKIERNRMRPVLILTVHGIGYKFAGGSDAS